jgi:hypothetical protein
MIMEWEPALSGQVEGGNVPVPLVECAISLRLIIKLRHIS